MLRGKQGDGTKPMALPTPFTKLGNLGINVYAQVLSMVEYDKYHADCYVEGYLDVGVLLRGNHARS